MPNIELSDAEVSVLVETLECRLEVIKQNFKGQPLPLVTITLKKIKDKLIGGA